MSNLLPAIEIEPKLPAERSIIWLHGLGADGNDFVPIVPELQLPDALAIRFIFPHAPIKPITINNGFKMRAWYDISSLSTDRTEDLLGIADSMKNVRELIEQEEKKGIDSKNIILAGFSQGAVIALNVGLRYKKPLAGILALSGYLPFAEQVLKEANSANKHIPIFAAHGTKDPIVPYPLGKSLYTTLTQATYPVEWHSYEMPHSVCAAEVKDISRWILKVFDK